jgi:O-antigen ligase
MSVLAGLVLCLLLTGSKGPALALSACIGLFALRRGHVLRVAVFALPMMLWLITSDSSPLAARLAAAEGDESTADRITVLNDSINQISDGPLAGSAFVELNSGFYPHNIFVEAPMALGVPAGLLFAGLAIFGLIRAWKELKGPNYLLALLYIQGVFAAAVSGSMFGSTLFWITLSLLPMKARAAKSARQSAPLFVADQT